MNPKHFAANGEYYKAEFGDMTLCSVKLLPQEGFLFSASLEWLDYFGSLNDRDATHTVPRETIDRIIQWAISEGYKWQPFNKEPQS